MPERTATPPAAEAPLAPLPVQIPAVEPAAPGRTFPLELDTGKVEESLKKLGDDLSHWAKQGRYTKVRFKFRGKPLLPDLPLAAVVAAEGLTFYWGGILRALLMNVAGRSLLDVELVHDAEKELQAGKEALLSGDLEGALAHFRRAVDMKRDGASGYLNLGVALKLKGDREASRQALQQARDLDAGGPVGVEAERLLATLGG